jgi:hypothetical protein
LQFMMMFWLFTLYFCTTLVYKTGKFIWKCLCNTCSFIFIPVRGLDAVGPGGPIPESARPRTILHEIHCPLQTQLI